MSKKSSRPGAKVALPQPAPRQLSEIESQYSQLVANAGQLQYQIHVYSRDLEKLNKDLESLNYEAHARKELDAKNPAAAIKTEEVKNEA